MFKKLEEKLNILSKNMEDIKKTHIQHLEMKSLMSEMI